MDFITANWMLILVALTSGGMLAWQAFGQGGGGGGLSPQEAVQQINREKAVVIDVCDAAEYAAGRVGGAKNVPLAELEQKLPGVVKNKALPVSLVCASGMRSARAASILHKAGFQKVYSLKGGIQAWRSAGLPVEK